MEQIEYSRVVSQIEELSALKENYDALISAGIPKTKVHHFEIPYSVNSGYSMGEVVIVRCNGKDVVRYDRTQEYAKSCKWRANHGRVVLNFTKKSLKEYTLLCVRQYEVDRRLRQRRDDSMEERLKELWKVQEDINTLLTQSLDKESSIIKNKR